MQKLADVLEILFSPYMLMGIGTGWLAGAFKLPGWSGMALYLIGAALIRAIRLGALHGSR